MTNSCASFRLFVQIAAILFLLFMLPYGSFGGSFEPTISVGAPAIVEIEKDIPDCGNGPLVNGTFAAEKASRSVWASTPLASGSTKPNTIALAGLTAPGANFQWAWVRICEIWMARNNASGSPSVYRRLTDPGLADKVFSSSEATVGGKARQATTSFIFSVSSRAFAASFSNSAARKTAFPAILPASMPASFAAATWAATPNLYCSRARLASTASSFCKRMMMNVETTTISAASAPSPKNTTMMLFQVSRERPNIRLTFLEKVAFSICAISCIGLLTIVALSITSLFRPHRSSKTQSQYPVREFRE